MEFYLDKKVSKSKFHWGTHLWAYIHTITIVDGNDVIKRNKHVISKLKAIADTILCEKCETMYRKYLIKLAHIDPRTPMALFYWSVDLHNAVNAELGKELISYQQAMSIWCQ